jgi:hypothetical protein
MGFIPSPSLLLSLRQPRGAFFMDYDEELKSVIAYWRSEMPAHIKLLKGQATFDLMYGPFAVGDEEDYPGFESACEALSEWAEKIEDIKLYDYEPVRDPCDWEFLSDEDDCYFESEVEVGEVSRTAIIRGPLESSHPGGSPGAALSLGSYSLGYN